MPIAPPATLLWIITAVAPAFAAFSALAENAQLPREINATESANEISSANSSHPSKLSGAITCAEIIGSEIGSVNKPLLPSMLK